MHRVPPPASASHPQGLMPATGANVDFRSRTELQRKIRLTCRCSVPYILNTTDDFRSRCIEERCRATLNMSVREFREYKTSLKALIKVFKTGDDYRQVLETVTYPAVKSHYSLDIIEIPTVKSGLEQSEFRATLSIFCPTTRASHPEGSKSRRKQAGSGTPPKQLRGKQLSAYRF